MSLDKQLWEKAEQLAARNYDIDAYQDTMTNGDVVVLLKHPELPGCMAHGATRDEALENLKEARTEYIYSLLVDDLPVPIPRGGATSTVVRQGDSAVEYREAVGWGAKLDKIFKPDTREENVSVSYRGDLVQQR